MKRRTTLIAVLCIALLVVAAPTAAYAYWVATGQTALTARSATFAVSAPASASGTTNALPASADDLSGFSGATLSSAVYTNTGAVPWSQLTVTVTTSTAFTGGATTSYGAAIVDATAPCPADAASYVALAAGAGTLDRAVAAGSSAKVCVRAAYAQLSVPNRTTTAGMQFTVTPRVGNWAVTASATAVTTTAPNAGLMRCVDDGGSDATLTFVAPITGTYRWVDTATGTGQAFTVGVEGTKTYPDQVFGTSATIAVRVDRQDGTAWTEVARGTVARTAAWWFIGVTYRCP